MNKRFDCALSGPSCATEICAAACTEMEAANCTARCGAAEGGPASSSASPRVAAAVTEEVETCFSSAAISPTTHSSQCTASSQWASTSSTSSAACSAGSATCCASACSPTSYRFCASTSRSQGEKALGSIKTYEYGCRASSYRCAMPVRDRSVSPLEPDPVLWPLYLDRDRCLLLA